jgi:hypothetical protein
MQVKEAIEYLTKHNELDDHIMIGWKAIEDLNGDELCPMPNLTIDVWNEACARADRNEYLFDNEMAEIIIRDVEYDIKNGALSS